MVAGFEDPSAGLAQALLIIHEARPSCRAPVGPQQEAPSHQFTLPWSPTC